MPKEASHRQRREAPSGGLRHHRPPTTLVVLPGVPAEMHTCFDAHVTALVAASAGGPVLLEREADTDCGDESALAPLLEVVREEFPDLYLKSRPVSFGREVRLTVTASGVGGAGAGRLEAALARLRALLKARATPASGAG